MQVRTKLLTHLLGAVVLFNLISLESANAASNFAVSKITVSPAVVNLTNGPVTVSASISIVSGNPIDLTRLPIPYFQRSIGFGSPTFEKWELSSGTPTNGTFTTQIIMPTDAMQGKWAVASQGFYDSAGVQSSTEGYVTEFDVQSGVASDPVTDNWNSALKSLDDLVSQSNTLLSNPAVKKLKNQSPFSSLRKDVELSQEAHHLVMGTLGLANLNKLVTMFSKDYGRAASFLKQKPAKKK